MKEEGNRLPPSTAWMRPAHHFRFRPSAGAFVEAGALGPQESTASSASGSDAADDV